MGLRNDRAFVVLLAHGGTFFGGSDVNFIALETGNTLVDGGKEPRGVAETRVFQGQSTVQKNVDQGEGEESEGEGTGNQLPGNGGKDSSKDGTQESHTKELLESIGDTKDVVIGGVSFFVKVDLDREDTSNNEEAKSDSHLTTNHETGEVASVVLEEQVNSTLGPRSVGTFGFGELADGEESDLHTFQHTNDDHEEEQQKDRGDRRNTIPDGGLIVKDSGKGDGNGETKNTNGEENTGPVEDEGESGLGGFLRFNGGLGEPVEAITDEVAHVHDTGELNSQSGVESDGHEVVVDVVKHTMRGIALRRELANVDVGQNHGNSRSQKDGSEPVGKTKDFGICKRSTTETNGEVDEDHHELTTHEVTVEVVALVAEGADAVGDGVRFLVQLTVDGGKTNHGALSSFDHRHPENTGPHDQKGDDATRVLRDRRLLLEHQSSDNADGEDDQSDGVTHLDVIEGAELNHGESKTCK